MSSYKILSCDLDGTLFTDGAHISAENDRAIRALAARGVLFVPNTGRTYSEIPQSLAQHPAVQYLICSDGAVIYDKKSSTHISLCMEKEASGRALDILADYDISLSLRQNGNCYVNAAHHNDAHYTAHRLDAEWQYFFYLNGIPLDDFHRFCYDATEPEMICAFFADKGERAQAIRRLSRQNDIEIASTDEANIEVFSKKAGKGNALLTLAKALGIDPAATVAVGDSTNDSDMILKAGLGLAMENACPELKSIADAVICKNTDHAVDYILKQYFSN